MLAGRGKKGHWGLGKGTKNGAVDSEHGASKSSSSQLRTRATIPSKRVISYIKYLQNTTHAIIFNIYRSCCMPTENTFSPLHVKYKLHIRETEHVFILGSMDCMVANKNNQQLLVLSSLAQQTFLYITEQLNINIHSFIHF